MAEMNGSSDPLTDTLLYLQYAMTFSDFPINFTDPALIDPNYIPPQRGESLKIFCYAAASVSLVIVCLRLYVRKFVQKHFGLDDWLILPALVCVAWDDFEYLTLVLIHCQFLSLAFLALQILLIQRYGVGVHIYDVPVLELRMTEMVCSRKGHRTVTY
jgi:hypothetical protein